jgi:5'-methylthioadenosine phosphorylase
VTVDQVIAVLNQNSENGQRLIRETVRVLDEHRPCKCGSALKSAILTDFNKISPTTKERLKLLVEKYVS